MAKMFTTAIWALGLASTTYGLSNAEDSVPTRDLMSVCGTVGRAASSHQQPAQRRSASPRSYYPRQAGNSSVLVPIDVYLQILSADGTEEGGNISDAALDTQMQILNDAFKPVGFKFEVKETIRTINAEWFYGLAIATPSEFEVSAALRKGGNGTLNIFSGGGLNTLGVGWATLPYELQYRMGNDGVYMNNTAMFGGTNPIYSKGGTLIHEVGHWMGLFHNFAASCEVSYDYVDDTPIENQPLVNGLCEIGQDTCPDKPGLDLIHNHMGYSSDECRNSFTPGQIQRMREQTAKFRRVVYPGIDPDNIPEDVLD